MSPRGPALPALLGLALSMAALAASAARVGAAPAPVSISVSARSEKETSAGKFFAPAFVTASERMQGVLATRDFTIRLPEHVRYQPGARLQLVFRASPLLLPEVSTVTVLLNGRELTSFRPLKDSEQPVETQTLSVPLAESDLRPGWNTLSLRCLLQTTSMPCRDVDNPASWIELEQGTGFEVAYAEQALFPELQRFPDAMAEPQLMRMGEFVEGSNPVLAEPTVTLLLPSSPGASELRGLLVCSARLAQTLYLRDHSLEVDGISAFADRAPNRNGILIGTREKMLPASLPAHFHDRLNSLQAGEGFLGEFILGDPGKRQRRWIVVSGADSEGLEKAIMSLGSAEALRKMPSNPWIVAQAPVISPLTEKLALPVNGPVTLRSLPDGAIEMKGLFRQETSRAWPLPPGWQTASGGKIELEFAHAENLDKTSAFEVIVNDQQIGSVALTADNAQTSRRVISIPSGLPGRDPSRLGIGAYMDIGTVDCAHRNEERAWLHIAGSSTIHAKAEPLVIDDLSRLNLLMMRDAFLRRAALVVPAESTPTRDKMLVSLGVYLGSQLSTLPVLWPQVATYGADQPADASRLVGRSGLVLGSSEQWLWAFPNGTPLAVADDGKGRLSLSGEHVARSDFDPGLAMAQLIPSPWEQEELFAVVGGIESYGGDVALRMLTDRALGDRLAGNIAAVDSGGRVLNYDTRYTNLLSLARHMRSGLQGTSDSTGLRPGEQLSSVDEATRVNRLIMAGFGGSLTIVFVAERLLTWRRNNNRKNNQRS